TEVSRRTPAGSVLRSTEQAVRYRTHSPDRAPGRCDLESAGENTKQILCSHTGLQRMPRSSARYYSAACSFRLAPRGAPKLIIVPEGIASNEYDESAKATVGPRQAEWPS